MAQPTNIGRNAMFSEVGRRVDAVHNWSRASPAEDNHRELPGAEVVRSRPGQPYRSATPAPRGYRNDRYVNHSCSPNLYFDADSREVEVCRDVERRELTLFYPSSAGDMSRPIECCAASAACLG
jgi:hypothetical protein